MQAMQLYVSPGACCLGAQVVAMALELPVEVLSVPLRRPDSPIHAVNPLGRVPALKLADGSVLTENAAILPYLADLRPGTPLFAPAGSAERARIQSWIGYIAAEVHAASFRPINRPERYSGDPAMHAAIRLRGREQLYTAVGPHALPAVRAALAAVYRAAPARLCVGLQPNWPWYQREKPLGAAKPSSAATSISGRSLCVT